MSARLKVRLSSAALADARRALGAVSRREAERSISEWLSELLLDRGGALNPKTTVARRNGVGAATEEAMLGAQQSYIFRYDTTEFCEGPWNPLPIFQDVPSGTRLVARLSASGALDAASPNCAIHGVS